MVLTFYPLLFMSVQILISVILYIRMTELVFYILILIEIIIFCCKFASEIAFACHCAQHFI